MPCSRQPLLFRFHTMGIHYASDTLYSRRHNSSITKPNRKSEIYNTYGAENTINDYLIIRENGKYEIQFKTEKNYTIMLKIGKYEERVKPERVDNSGYIEQFKYNMFMKAVERLSRPNTQLNHWNYWDDVAKLKKVYNIK